MEEAQKSRNDQGGNKKMVIKSGGGIGPVLLFGGALAAAALASAFAVRRKRRSSGGDHTRNSSPDINKKMEDTRKEAKEEVWMEDVIISDESLKMDDKGKVESDDDGFVMVKEEISLHEKENVELKKEDVSSNIQDNGVGGVEVSLEKKELEVLCNGNGEINEERSADNVVVYEEGEATVEMVLEDAAVEEENQHSYEEAKESHLVDDSSEVREDRISLGNLYGLMEMEETGEEAATTQTQKKDSEKEVDQVEMVAPEDDPRREIEKDVADFEGTTGDMGNGEVAESTELIEKKIVRPFVVSQAASEADEEEEEEQQQQQDPSYVISQAATEADEEEEEEEEQEEEEEEEDPSYVIKEEGIDDDKKEEGSVDSSNWKPLEQAKLIKYEMGGRIIEDPKVYIPLGKGVEYQTNSSRRRMIILTLSVLSSLSCCWFFNLPTAKLCLVAFLTVFLLEIYGYSLLNHAAKGDGSYEKRS